MSQTLNLIIELVKRGEVRVSSHGYDELAADGIFIQDIIESLPTSIVVEDYPTFHTEHRFMWYGDLQEALPLPRLSSRPIDLIR